MADEHLEKWRADMRRDAPDLLEGLDQLIAKYKLNDELAFELIFDADCDRQVGVKQETILEATAYDIEHGLRSGNSAASPSAPREIAAGIKLSDELRELLPEARKRYDEKKVMAWLNKAGPQLLITVQQLEEDYDKHNPGIEFIAKTSGLFSQFVEEMGTALYPFYLRFFGRGTDEPSIQKLNEFLYLTEKAVTDCMWYATRGRSERVDATEAKTVEEFADKFVAKKNPALAAAIKKDHVASKKKNKTPKKPHKK
jgi:hypothetical protein